MILKPTCFKSLFPYSLLKVLLTFNLRPVSTGIYKTFVRPQLDYGDILYEKAYNSSFHQKIESGQYNRCLAITCAIRGTSKERFYDELGLESLTLCHWFRKLRYFHKFSKHESPQFLFKLVPLTLSWRRPLSYRNQSIDLQSKSIDWFLYDNGLRHERVKTIPLRHEKYLKHTPFSKQNITFSKILFFPQLLPSGTILTITFEMFEALVLLKTVSWNLSGQPPIMFLIMKIIEESNLLQDCVLALFIYVNTKSNIAFQIHWILFAVAVLMLNQLFLTYYTVPCAMMKVIPSWALWKTSIVDC